MSVYSNNHGDTEAVRLVMMNDYGTYKAVMDIVNRVPWWDDEDSTWNDIGKAAREYRGLMDEIDRNADGFTDLLGVDYDSVDFRELIANELVEINLQEKRSATAGL